MHALDILRYGHLLVLRTVDGVGSSLADQPGACGVWSIREIVAHLASYEALLAEIAAHLNNGSEMPLLASFAAAGSAFNDQEVAARQDQNLAALVEEYSTHYEKAITALRLLPPSKFQQTGLLEWYGAAYDLDDFLVYMYYAHKREHCAQIELMKERFKA